MTIAFHIELNGQPLCLAGVEEGVLTAIATHNTAHEGLSLNVGGLLTQPNTHASWAKQDLAVGDQITLKVVDVIPDDISQPIEESIEPDGLLEQQERLCYETLKQKFEPTA